MDAVEHFHSNIWPPPHMGLDLQPAMSAYYRAMEGLSRVLLQLCALALVCTLLGFSQQFELVPLPSLI